MLLRARGFTLLELLVVLALMALVTGLVAPLGARWLEQARERGLRDELQALLTALPLEAQAQAQARDWTAISLAERLQSSDQVLPPGWQLRVPLPLRYGANGVAGGGSLSLHAPDGRAWQWRIEAPTGRLLPG